MAKAPKTLRPASLLVHGGTIRSNFGETSEALFLTSSFVFGSAAEAAAASDAARRRAHRARSRIH